MKYISFFQQEQIKYDTILIQNEKSIQVYNGERSKTSLLSHLEKL